MVSNSTISITFRLEGDIGGFKKLSMDADGFCKVMGAVVVEAEKLKSSIVNFAASATNIDSVNKSICDLQSVENPLAGQYENENSFIPSVGKGIFVVRTKGLEPPRR